VVGRSFGDTLWLGGACPDLLRCYLDTNSTILGTYRDIGAARTAPKRSTKAWLPISGHGSADVHTRLLHTKQKYIITYSSMRLFEFVRCRLLGGPHDRRLLARRADVALSQGGRCFACLELVRVLLLLIGRAALESGSSSRGEPKPCRKGVLNREHGGWE
jgi:hypothetical protein